MNCALPTQLGEALFADRFQLIAVAHPQGAEDLSNNEGMTDPPRPFRLFRTRGATAARMSAFDDHGNDVLSRIAPGWTVSIPMTSAVIGFAVTRDWSTRANP